MEPMSHDPAAAGVGGAVVANGADFAQQFKELEGLSVIVTGTRLDGASIRMAGPEIQATTVVAASDASPACSRPRRAGLNRAAGWC